MKKSNSMLEGLADLLRAGLIALALFMDMELRSWNNYSNWFTSFQPYTFGVSAAAALAFIALRWGRKRLPAPSCRMRIAALFLGAWQVAAVSVVHTVNINQPFLTSGQVMKAAVMALATARPSRDCSSGTSAEKNQILFEKRGLHLERGAALFSRRVVQKLYAEFQIAAKRARKQLKVVHRRSGTYFVATL